MVEEVEGSISLRKVSDGYVFRSPRFGDVRLVRDKKLSTERKATYSIYRDRSGESFGEITMPLVSGEDEYRAEHRAARIFFKAYAEEVRKPIAEDGFQVPWFKEFPD